MSMNTVQIQSNHVSFKGAAFGVGNNISGEFMMMNDRFINILTLSTEFPHVVRAIRDMAADQYPLWFQIIRFKVSDKMPSIQLVHFCNIFEQRFQRLFSVFLTKEEVQQE